MKLVNNLIHKITWAEYTRKSSDEESGKQHISIQRQKDELNNRFPDIKRGFCFSESKSAFTPNNRPEFSKLITLIEEGEINGILAWHPDRLSRNPIEAGKIVQLIVDGKLTKLKFGSYTFDNTPEGIMLLQFALSQSQYFSAKLSKDVKSGNVAHLKRGKWLGFAKPGYINCQNPVTREKYIDKDPKRFPLLKKAFRLLLTQAYTPMEVLDILNNEWGYLTKPTRKRGNKPLSESSFYRVISDPYYYGLMVRKEGEFIGNHEPMISEEDFNKIQIRLGKKGKPHLTKHSFPYKELLKCGECGGNITCEEKWQIICPVCKTKFAKGKSTDQCLNCKTLLENMKKPKILHYVYYHCTKKTTPNCSQGSVRLDKLEEQIYSQLSTFKIPKNFKNWAIEYLNEVTTKELKSRQEISRNLESTILVKKQMLDNLLLLKINPNNQDGSMLSDEQFLEKKQKLEKDIKKLMKKRIKLEKKAKEFDKQTEEAFDLACYGQKRFNNGGVKVKTEILAKFGSNLIIKDKKFMLNKKKPYYLIQKGKKRVIEEFAKLEPNKKVDLGRITYLPRSISTVWRTPLQNGHLKIYLWQIYQNKLIFSLG